VLKLTQRWPPAVSDDRNDARLLIAFCLRSGSDHHLRAAAKLMTSSFQLHPELCLLA
jgi:hypothetical protein